MSQFANCKAMLQLITVSLSLFFNALLIYFVITKSSKKLGNYRHLMCYFSFFSMIYAIIDFLVQPVGEWVEEMKRVCCSVHPQPWSKFLNDHGHTGEGLESDSGVFVGRWVGLLFQNVIKEIGKSERCWLGYCNFWYQKNHSSKVEKPLS